MLVALDPATLKMFTALVAAVSLIVLAALVPREVTGSRACWITGLGLLALQWLICVGKSGLPELPRALCPQVCSTLSLLAVTALSCALWRLVRPRVSWAWVVVALLLALALAGGAAAGLAEQSHARLIDLAKAVILLAGAVALRRPLADVPDRLRYLLTAAVVVAALSMGLRVDQPLAFAQAGSPGVAPGALELELASLLLAQVALVVGTLSYVLLLRARAIAQLRRAAELDPLTGVLNRAALHARLTRTGMLNGSGRAGVVVMLFDVLELGVINRTAGHLVGDRILQTVAQALRHALPHGASLGRYAADQFLVALRADGAPAQTLAEQLCAALAAAVQETRIRVVAGVAESRAEAPDLLRLASLAEIDLRAAKEARRGPEPAR